MTEPDVDARLRGYADRWRGAQTQPPTVGELTVPSSSSARSRSSLVLAVAASVVTVAVIAGGAILIGRHGNATPVAHPALSVVPWNPTGVMPVQTTVPFPARVGASAGTKQCTASDFTLASTHTEPDLDSSGWLNTSYVLRSTAARTCSVSAYGINAALIDSAGQSLPNDAPQPAGPVMFPGTLAVSPGQFVSAQTRWAVYKGRAPQPDRVALFTSPQQGTAPDLTLTIPLGAVTIPPHPQSPYNGSPWRAGLYSGRPQVNDLGALTTLTPTIQAASTVANGTTAAFTVRLANDTDVAISLEPCPQFIALLSSGPKRQTTEGIRGPLNCASAPNVIAPGASVTFAVELHPMDLIPGPGNLEWQLVSGEHAVADVRAQLTVS